MNATVTLPASADIRARMQSCREELRALTRLLRAAEAAEAAERARRARERPVEARGAAHA
jgi:hypothetical protein